MALVVEDGTGLTNANAYVDVDTVDAYHVLRCNKGWSGSTEAKDAAIVRATEWIDRTFDFMGEIKNAGDSASSLDIQALAWPRNQVFHEEGYLVDPDSLPIQVVNAAAEVALVALTGVLDPSVRGPLVRSMTERVGRVTQTRSLTAAGQAEQVDIPTVYLILKPLLARGGAGGHSGLVRT